MSKFVVQTDLDCYLSYKQEIILYKFDILI